MLRNISLSNFSAGFAKYVCRSPSVIYLFQDLINSLLSPLSSLPRGKTLGRWTLRCDNQRAGNLEGGIETFT
jgi:hypothetical protein